MPQQCRGNVRDAIWAQQASLNQNVPKPQCITASELVTKCFACNGMFGERQTSTPARDRGSHVDGYLVLRFTTVQLMESAWDGF